MTSNSAPLFDNAIEGDQRRTSSSDVSSSTTGKRPTSEEGSGPSKKKKEWSQERLLEKEDHKKNPKNKGVISPAAKIKTRDIFIVKLKEANRMAGTLCWPEWWNSFQTLQQIHIHARHERVRKPSVPFCTTALCDSVIPER